MLYFGVYLHKSSLKITALSEGFAHLDTKYFEFNEIDRMYQWIDSFKLETNEKCSLFFDESNYKECGRSPFESYFDDGYNYFYLVKHRKLLDIMQFLYEFALKTESPIMFDFDSTFILASTFRLFGKEEIKLCEPEFYAF